MPQPKPPSMCDIARAVGVSTMTVSNALRGKGQVAAATRERILAAAERLGYRDDPLLVQLMNHLRGRRVRRSQANLGLLLLSDHSYTRRLLAGIRQRTEELGYALDIIRPESYAGNAEGFTRMLVARGITGLLLPPSAEPRPLNDLLDWSRFAAVAMTYSIMEPHFHRVVPHHFHNATLLFNRLWEAGFRRPALALQQGHRQRAHGAFDAALALTALQHGKPPVPPFWAEDENLSGYAAWHRRHKPDALVLGDPIQVVRDIERQIGTAATRRMGFCAMDFNRELPHPGIDQNVSLIGSTGVDMLVAALHRGERGPPAKPIITMVEGAWVEGAGLPPPAARR